MPNFLGNTVRGIPYSVGNRVRGMPNPLGNTAGDAKFPRKHGSGILTFLGCQTP